MRNTDLDDQTTMDTTEATAITTEVTSGDYLFTTITTASDGQPVVEIVEPTTLTTTFESGSVPYTTITTADGGQPVVEVIEPTPSVPGVAYHALFVPESQSTNKDANATYFNHNPNAIFAGTTLNTNFQTDSCGVYNFGEPQGIFDTTRKAVIYQGYFRADVRAYYRMLTLITSLTVYIWTGEKAFSAWSQDNYDCLDRFGSEQSHRYRGCETRGLELQAGETVPITILWINFDEFDGARGVRFNFGAPAQKKKRDSTVFDSYFLLPTMPDRFTYHIENFSYTGQDSTSNAL